MPICPFGAAAREKFEHFESTFRGSLVTPQSLFLYQNVYSCGVEDIEGVFRFVNAYPVGYQTL